jgi:hypothetical protein
MLVSDLLVDAFVFGALLLGAMLDGALPATHGAGSLLAVGAALYLAAQEASAFLERRKVWTQESLWTSLSLCTAGLAYYWWRNQSDLALLALSVALMLSSLMVAISFISGVGAIVRGNAGAFGGLLGSLLGALALGAVGGGAIIALGQPSSSLPLAWKIGVVVLSFVLWKAREKARPPQQNTLETAAPVVAEDDKRAANIYGVKAGEAASVAPATSGSHRAVVPQRGTVFDRLGPVLVLGLVLLAIASSGSKLAAPITSRAVATETSAAQPAPGAGNPLAEDAGPEDASDASAP